MLLMISVVELIIIHVAKNEEQKNEEQNENEENLLESKLAGDE